MARSDEKTKRAVVSSIFPSLFFAALGLLLAQLWVSQLHGSFRFHLMLAVPGCALMGTAVYRAKLHWVADAGFAFATKARDMLCLLVFAGVGMTAGLVISAGSFLGLAVLMGLMYLSPWASIAVCRTHFIVSSFAILAGAVAWLAFHNVQVHPFHYLVMAWVLWLPPTLMQLLVVARLDKDYRVGQRYSAAQRANPEVPAHQ